jgi:hypothetical protein
MIGFYILDPNFLKFLPKRIKVLPLHHYGPAIVNLPCAFHIICHVDSMSSNTVLISRFHWSRLHIQHMAFNNRGLKKKSRILGYYSLIMWVPPVPDRHMKSLHSSTSTGMPPMKFFHLALNYRLQEWASADVAQEFTWHPKAMPCHSLFHVGPASDI